MDAGTILQLIWSIMIVIGALIGLGIGIGHVASSTFPASFGWFIATPFLVVLGALAGVLGPIVIIGGLVFLLLGPGGVGEAVGDEIGKSIDRAATRPPQGR